MPELRELVAATLAASDPPGLLALLRREDPDEVMHLVAAELGRRPVPEVLLWASRLNSIQEAALAELTKREQIGVLNAQGEALRLTVARAGEARVRLYKAIGRLIDSLPEDKGGRLKPGEPEPPRRAVRRDLGLGTTQTTQLVALARMAEDKFEAYAARIREGEAPPKTPGTIVRVVETSQWSSDEFFTPSHLLAAARRALRVVQFGCDPYSRLAAQAGLVKAARWYGGLDRGAAELNLAKPLGYSPADLDDAVECCAGSDGHTGEWDDDWWCNPPFSADNIGVAHERVEAELSKGKRGVLLINCDPSKAHQQALLRRCCSAWPLGRESFWSPIGRQLTGNRHTQVLFGINVDPRDWREAFDSFAATTQPIPE